MASQLLFNETPSIKRAASLINGLDGSKFSLLVARIVQKLHLRDERNFTEDEELKLQSVFALEAKDLELVLETVSFFLEQVVIQDWLRLESQRYMYPENYALENEGHTVSKMSTEFIHKFGVHLPVTYIISSPSSLTTTYKNDRTVLLHYKHAFVDASLLEHNTASTNISTC
jgi:hypothetical protein